MVAKIPQEERDVDQVADQVADHFSGKEKKEVKKALETPENRKRLKALLKDSSLTVQATADIVWRSTKFVLHFPEYLAGKMEEKIMQMPTAIDKAVEMVVNTKSEIAKTLSASHQSAEATDKILEAAAQSMFASESSEVPIEPIKHSGGKIKKRKFSKPKGRKRRRESRESGMTE